MITLFRLLARVPMPLMHRLGAMLGWLVWWCAPDYRRRFKAHAERAGFAPDQYRPAIAAAGKMASELPWLWLRPQGETVLPRVVRWEGVEAFEAAMQAKKGVILVAPHLGSCRRARPCCCAWCAGRASKPSKPPCRQKRA